jgi:hypothetical protein
MMWYEHAEGLRLYLACAVFFIFGFVLALGFWLHSAEQWEKNFEEYRKRFGR